MVTDSISTQILLMPVASVEQDVPHALSKMYYLLSVYGKAKHLSTWKAAKFNLPVSQSESLPLIFSLPCLSHISNSDLSLLLLFFPSDKTGSQKHHFMYTAAKKCCLCWNTFHFLFSSAVTHILFLYPFPTVSFPTTVPLQPTFEHFAKGKRCKFDQ